MDREENEHRASEEALAAVEGNGTLTAPSDLRPLPLPAELPAELPDARSGRYYGEHGEVKVRYRRLENEYDEQAPSGLRPFPLPAELRNMIYDLCYGEEREIKVRFRRDWRSSEKLREENKGKDFVVCSTSIQGNTMLMLTLTAYSFPDYILGSSARQQAVFRRSRPSLGAEQSFHPQLSIR